MVNSYFFKRLGLLGLFLSLVAQVRAGQSGIVVDVTKPGPPISPRLYGIFFEEISRSGDGGLYAEMVENRSFEDFNQPLGWTLLSGGGSSAAMSLDQSHPLNGKNPTSLRLDFPALSAGARAGVFNQGFKGSLVPDAHDPVFTLAGAEQDKVSSPYKQWLERDSAAQKKPANGMNIEAGKVYRLSLWVRASPSFAGPLTASLERQNGAVLASQNIGPLSAEWKQAAVSLKASAGDPDARLVLSARVPGTVWLDMVSLFPAATWRSRPNGLRADMMQMLAALHPAFVRFPGGSYGEGYTLKGAYRWKETLGNLAERPGHWNIWGYRSSDGLGFHELLQMCEDLNATPLYVPNCGIAEKEMVSVDQEGPWIQDALDALAYADAPAQTTWEPCAPARDTPRPLG